jgi:thiosulfate/3-mercaptopyruvate sulfurtransferase
MSLALVCLTFALAADPTAYPKSEMIVEPAALANKEFAENSLIFDIRGEQSYKAGHIPGAVRIDVAAMSKAFLADPTGEKHSWQLGDLGISGNTRAVIYGDDWREAARAWWLIRYFGATDVRLLNGGWTAWKASGGAVSTKAEKINRMMGPGKAVANRLATKADVLAIVKDKSAQIIDARTDGEFCGTAGSAPKKGAIRGAINLEWCNFIDSKTQKLKPKDEIAKLLKDAGIDPNKPAVTYCQSGGRASVSAFVLELMGGQQVRNYYRSWAEWGNADDTPVAKPERK